MTKNVKSQVLTKNIDVIYYYIYRLMKEEKIYIESIFRLLILVDRLIKVLLIIGLKRYRELLRLMDRNKLLEEKKSCNKKEAC